MKITEFMSNITRLEGGKRQVDVAQTSEIIKLVNRELWGIPYVLIRFKGSVIQILSFFCVYFVSGVAIAMAVSSCHPWRLHEPDPGGSIGSYGGVYDGGSEPQNDFHSVDDCMGNHPPVAVIQATQVTQ